jgi:hypothetical protein
MLLDPAAGQFPPVGWVVGTTVCAVPVPPVSAFVHITVLLTPMTTVTLLGA